MSGSALPRANVLRSIVVTFCLNGVMHAPDRQSHGAVSVGCDAEHGVDGTQTGGVVERQPQVAQTLAERPVLARQQVDRVERHRDGPNQQVADCQRSDEVVARLADRSLKHERQDDDQVAADRQQADADRQQSEYGHVPQRQQRRPVGLHRRSAVGDVVGGDRRRRRQAAVLDVPGE